MKFFTLIALLFTATSVAAQNNGFPFGQVTYRELDMKTYELDTTATAVFLNEFGEAYFDSEGDHNIIFEYHAKIKILKKQGLELADFEIPLRKNAQYTEKLRSVKASAFNVENGSMREVKLDSRNVFTEDRNKYLDVKKFAIPNVRVGSVIEIQYILESPFLMNFRTWHFQSNWPKVKSEYWALLPGPYIYNMTLRGFLQMSKNESSVLKNCLAVLGGRTDCARYKFGMNNIPAFVEEDYMLAKSNFLSSVVFELSEIRHFDGRRERITKEWKDVEQELRMDSKFGVQLRRGEDIVDKQIEDLIAGETNPLNKAKKVYEFIKSWYRWDEVMGKYSEFGIRKAFEKRTGNIGDINLSLIAALRYAGLSVEPVILSTRDNGLPIELHPVMTDFNYVIAKVNIGDQVYLADATDDFYPFGVLPEHCLNGKGRVIGDENSYWIELKPSQKARQSSRLNIKLDSTGTMRGTLQSTYSGYEAVRMRKRIASHASVDAYIENVKTRLNGVEVTKAEVLYADDVEKPLVQNLEITFDAFGQSDKSFLFNPFLIDRWKENPFRSNERLYPVDFGTALEEVALVEIEYPQNFEIVNLPERIGLLLPNNGGRYVLEVRNGNNKVSLSNALTLNKTIFTSEEYHYLKELFNRVIQVQNSDLLFKRKQ